MLMIRPFKDLWSIGSGGRNGTRFNRLSGTCGHGRPILIGSRMSIRICNYGLNFFQFLPKASFGACGRYRFFKKNLIGVGEWVGREISPNGIEIGLLKTQEDLVLRDVVDDLVIVNCKISHFASLKGIPSKNLPCIANICNKTFIWIPS